MLNDPKVSKTLLKNIQLSYNEIKVFEDFDLSVPYGQITCIVGPSGCGKTSLLNITAGLLNDFKGKVDTQGEKIGYVFQEDRLLPWETVYNNVKLVGDIEDRKLILSILEDLELIEFKDKYPDELSGGMKQRCALARGFYFGGSLLLMDEPFKSLDYDLRLNLIKYLRTLWEHNKSTIIFVTHDIDEALLLGHEIKVLSKRPTKIKASVHMKTELTQRHVMNEEHVTLRSSIIQLMSSM